MYSLISVVIFGLLLSACTNAESQCNNGALRLANRTSFLEGRLEICNNNKWGTVCDDEFDNNDARVACRQLGLSDAGATAVKSAAYGQGNGSIWLSELMCTGEEATLSHCVSNKCQHDEDVGVQCSKPDGVLLILKGQLYSNNSVVSIENIGHGLSNASVQYTTLNNRALLCVTDKTPCCDSQASVSGHWFYPNGSIVSSDSSNGLFTSRGNDQTVRLNYQGGDFAPGIYHCEILDQNDVIQNLYVGIYGNSSTEGSVMVSELAYDSSAQTLVCTSVGGPVTDLVWSKDMMRVDMSKYSVLQELIDPVGGVYRNTLVLNDKSSADSGTYECRVENALSQDYSSITLSVCRNGETRFSNENSATLEICSGDQWFSFSDELLVRAVTSAQPAIEIELETNSTFVKFKFKAEIDIEQFQLSCSTRFGSTVSQITKVEPFSNGTFGDTLFSLQPSVDYHCCVTVVFDSNLLEGLKHISRDCIDATTDNITPDTPVTPVIYETDFLRMNWLLFVLGGGMLLALLILVVVTGAWVACCIRRSRTNGASVHARSGRDGPADLTGLYTTITNCASRQNSVADNPIYGGPQAQSTRASIDTKETLYDTVDLAQKNAQAKLPSPYENEYSTIADKVPAATDVQNPVYGGPIRYSQLQFGKFN